VGSQTGVFESCGRQKIRTKGKSEGGGKLWASIRPFFPRSNSNRNGNDAAQKGGQNRATNKGWARVPRNCAVKKKEKKEGPPGIPVPQKRTHEEYLKKHKKDEEQLAKRKSERCKPTLDERGGHRYGHVGPSHKSTKKSFGVKPLSPSTEGNAPQNLKRPLGGVNQKKKGNGVTGAERRRKRRVVPGGMGHYI